MSEPAKTMVDLQVYTMDAVLKSAYRFTNRGFVEIGEHSGITVEVTIRPKREEDSAESMLGEFLNELIDERLRVIVADETRATRDLIMAHALSQTGFIRPDLETADYRSDPSGIGVSDKNRSRC